MVSPIRPTDDDARETARTVIAGARFAALGVIGPDGAPLVTRVAFGLDPDGRPMSLVSDLAAHTGALRACPACSLLVGEPGPRGDPLTHPRLTIQAQAAIVRRDDPSNAEMTAHWLRGHPKAKLYAGFADFSFVRYQVSRAHLNGGFGKAFLLSPDDLGLAD